MICPDYAQPQYLIFSNTVPSLIYFSHLPAMLMSLLLGFFVYTKNRKSLIGKILLALSITFFLWAFFNLILWASNDSNINIFYWSFFGLLYPFLYILGAYLVYVFIENADPPFYIKLIFGLALLPIILLTPTRYNMEGFNINGCGAYEGNLFTNYYYIVGLLIFFWILVFSIKKYRNAKKEFKKQILLFSLGIEFFLLSFFISGYLSSFLLELGVPDFSLEQYGLFGMIVFLGFLSYLIVKHQAFDIKVITAQFLIVTTWIGVFSQLFIVQETSNRILTGITLALITYFGWLLFKAVNEEVKSAQELALSSRKLAGLNAKLEELDRAKSEFISIASHQLRTPLTSVKGFTSLILDNTLGKAPLKQKKEVEKIFVNNEKLCLLVEDMLNASRLEAGRLEYDLEEADVVSVVKSTVSVVSLYAKSRKLKLKLNLPNEKLMAIIDQRKLSEILSNLIDNAIKYTPRGNVSVIVEKISKEQKVGKAKNTALASRNWVRISVTDTGLGMDKKQLTGIFDKFIEGNDAVESKTPEPIQSFDEIAKKDADKIKHLNAGSRTTSGTGLGVYISRQMTQAMGGVLYADSPGKGKGSTFTLELPLVRK